MSRDGSATSRSSEVSREPEPGPGGTGGKRLRRPPLWWRTSLRRGLLVQALGTALGIVLLALACGVVGGPAWLRSVALVVGLLLVYLDTHALGHFVVGRAVGIAFSGFGVRGTDHPEDYPPGLRQLMSVVPMWTAITDPVSRRAAAPLAQAAMFAAGETATTVCTVAAAAAASICGAPLGFGALVVVVVWNVTASVVVAFVDKGDYRKAIRAWRARAS